MKPIRTFQVTPSLPAALERLVDLAYNLRWAWNHDTIELFRRLDSDLWEACGHNPVRMLGAVEQVKLEIAAADDAYLAHLDRVAQNFARYMAGEPHWFRRCHAKKDDCPLIAYFSAEFGLTECLSIFAGGLGILAGDHLKSASDLGVPLVGVGLLYQQGYFSQYLNEAGLQREEYDDNDFHNLPLRLERGADGRPVSVVIRLAGRNVTAQVWRVAAGRVPLYLLDTNLAVNTPEDRDITDQLYGGDKEMRIKQEILLGIGGYRALEVLGLEPTVFHMNEGHSAFLGLERVRRLKERQGMSLAEARELASSSLVFTTHTPVEAGHDYFPADLMARYFSDYAEQLGMSFRDFLALGRQNPSNEKEDFCMTVLALRLAAHSNAVSKLHGEVSRKMWSALWAGVPEAEIPIQHVTNGVHFRSWISAEMNELYDRYLGPKWREEPADWALWGRVEQIPSEELWRTHERRRDRLVAFARRRLREQLRRRGRLAAEVEIADEVLDSQVLTIGFARRFATYKRATLLLKNPERLEKILNAPGRPVQVIFAGKAHPRDDAGKELIKKIVELARQPAFRRRLVFLENYDLAVARYLVQGVDVWLNTPRRPLEASGTSGMKAAANGVLNLSTLDGWWDEAWRTIDDHQTPIGWAIGRGEDYTDPEEQDQVEADALYDQLELDVVPTFYERRGNGVPRKWVDRMKSSIGNLCSSFNTHRMVREYTEQHYLPADANYRKLAAEGGAKARALARWKARLLANWPQVKVESVDGAPMDGVTVSSAFQTRIWVHLGALTPADVTVQLYLGRVSTEGELVDGDAIPMRAVQSEGARHLYEAKEVSCRASGLHGYTVRVLPRHEDLVTPFLPGCIVWA